jgi:hypothetical protein
VAQAEVSSIRGQFDRLVYGSGFERSKSRLRPEPDIRSPELTAAERSSKDAIANGQRSAGDRCVSSRGRFPRCMHTSCQGLSSLRPDCPVALHMAIRRVQPSR